MNDAGGEQKLAFAQVLRGFAALLVVFWHFMEAGSLAVTSLSASIVEPTESTTSPPVESTVAFPISPGLFDLGQIGVGIFFIISGFVIPFAFQRQTRRGFIIGRLFRIWPTYAAGFTISLLVVAAYYASDNSSMPYSLTHIIAHYSLIGRDLAGFSNIDMIVWTLEIEIRFYIFCVLIAPLLRRVDAVGIIASGLVVAFFAIAFCAAGAFAPEAWRHIVVVLEGSAQFITFMMIGVIFHLLLRGALSPLQAVLTAAVFFAAFLWVGMSGGNPRTLPWLVANYGTGLAIFWIAYLCRAQFAARGPLGTMGDISYSLYAVHPLLGGWIVLWLTQTGLPFLMAAGIGLVIVSALAWVLHEMVEKPSHAFGRRIAARVVRRRAPDMGGMQSA